MTIRELLEDYEFKRNAAEYAAKWRRDRIMHESPVIAELFDKKTELLLENMEAALNGKSRDIRADVAEITDQINAKMAQIGFDSADLEPKYSCPYCADHGYVERNGKREYCVCFRREIYRKIYHARPINELQGSLETFDTTIYPGAQKIKTAAERYVREYPDNPRRNMVLMGRAGQGKTFMMECVAKGLHTAGADVLYLTATETNDIFRKNRLGELGEIGPVFDAKVLLIDDLGTEPMTKNVTIEYFYHLIDHRLQGGLHTWIATNLNTRDINARYGERTASRMFDNRHTGVITFAGDDLRLRGREK